MAKEKNKQEEAEAQVPQEGKKKKGKLLLIVVLAAVVLVGGAAGAYFFVFSKGGDGSKKEATKAEGVNFALEPFVVNLMDQGGTKYLKVSVQLELAKPELTEKAKMKTAQLRDAIITVITNKTSDELIAPEGKLLLKDEIKQRANQILGEGSVINVYLTDFVMQ